MSSGFQPGSSDAAWRRAPFPSFDQLDADGDGVISRAEFAQLMGSDPMPAAQQQQPSIFASNAASPPPMAWSQHPRRGMACGAAMHHTIHDFSARADREALTNHLSTNIFSYPDSVSLPRRPGSGYLLEQIEP